MAQHQQAPKAQKLDSIPVYKNKKGILSQPRFLRRRGCISLGFAVWVVSVLTLVNIYGSFHVLSSSHELRLISTTEQVIHEVSAVWVMPTKGQVVHDHVRFEAALHSTISKNFTVDRIIFTGWWPGIDMNSWKNICSISHPKRRNIFQCEGNFHLLRAPSGNITVSFDMYDTHNHVKLAPDGGFVITYVPLALL